MLGQSIDSEEGGRGIKFLMLHKSNYIYPYSYTTSNEDQTGQRSELVYQLSFKLLPVEFWGKGNGFTIGYTQKSIWQLYDKDNSRPFRETVYNPEFFLTMGWKTFKIYFGHSHESNGREDPDSRSWDSAFLQFKYFGSFMDISLRGWYVLYEEEGRGDEFPAKAESITDCYGHGELQLTFKGKSLFMDMAGRYNTSTKKGSFRSTLSTPINKHIFWGVEYFFGYGDSLIDYNHSTNRYSIGLLFNR